MPLRPSDIAPRIERAIAQRTTLIAEYRTLATEAAQADVEYDQLRESIKLKKRLVDGVKSNVEAETWATVDVHVGELNLARKVKAAEVKACLLSIDNLSDAIRFLGSELVRERMEDEVHRRHGAG